MTRGRIVLLLALVAGALFAAAASAAPRVLYSCPPDPDSCSTGWYRQPVTVKWEWIPSSAQIEAGCDSNDPVDFDTAATTRYCKVRDATGATTVEVPLKVDMTPPVVMGAAADRQPDANGWYRSPVQVAFSGTDAMSGLLGCTSATYGGPDSASATVTGVCRDRAGNTSGEGSFALRFDATPPSLADVTAVSADHVVRLRWAVPDGAVDLWRSPGRRGESRSMLYQGAGTGLVDRSARNGVRYEYGFTAVDQAGNTATRTIAVTPGPRLLAPEPRAALGEPPLLRWTKVRGARYYNVQLFRRGRKVLSAWPRRPRLQLERRWRYRGKRKLVAGRYRWIVWPGEGPRARNDYGARVGERTFTIAPNP